jgi:uncharacterized protein YecT (DUF1311 family)
VRVLILLLLVACAGCDQASSPAEMPADVPRAEPPPLLTGPVASSFSTAYDRCMETGEASQGMDPAMIACSEAEFDRQDAALNAAYAAALKVLRDEAVEQAALGLDLDDSNGARTRQARVRAAQRDWLRYRDSKCLSENQSGGTMDRLTGRNCVIEETIRRTSELRSLAGRLAD